MSIMWITAILLFLKLVLANYASKKLTEAQSAQLGSVSIMPKQRLAASGKAPEQSTRPFCITVHLPVTAQLIVPALIAHKPDHILKRISQEQTNLMRKAAAEMNPLLQMMQVLLQRAAVAQRPQKFLYLRLLQMRPQQLCAVDQHQRTLAVKMHRAQAYTRPVQLPAAPRNVLALIAVSLTGKQIGSVGAPCCTIISSANRFIPLSPCIHPEYCAEHTPLPSGNGQSEYDPSESVPLHSAPFYAIPHR